MRFQVNDMTCGHCTKAVEKAIEAAGGSAKADLPSKVVTVENLGTQPAIAAIREAGYTAQPLD
ncbi:heavy-metal-associated domain-containing protein [Paracoccus sp. Z118]|uniref:heavy-metal-associated domain-containing protein n=1 Tax=Paracoccus sp. Z118 TaxID=2851017 RepID=UPI001C2CA9AA|nr:heavy-metal-associated domain-containing protein [Paracoccus sp. Z118]MBV0890522.1 heavy-metal-associated domain-containing protein [Paracoccus sp. Z118]